MALQAGIDHLGHLGMTGEILGHRHGVAAMAFHAQRQSLQAAQGEEAVEGTLNGADGVLQKGKLIGQSGVVADHQDAADHVGVAVEVLRGRMHDHVEAELQRPLDPRSEEHKSELQSLMRISYDVYCLKKKK